LFLLASCGRVGFERELDTDASTSGAFSRLQPRPGQDFDPVTHEVAQRSSAAGAIPSQGYNVNCTLAIAKPLNTVDGDLLVGIITTDVGLGGAIAVPGWTALSLASPNNIAIYKIAAGDPATFQFSITAGTDAQATCESAGVIGAFTGASMVATSSVLDAQTNALTIVAPSLDAPRSGMLVGLFGSNGPSTGMTPPPGMLSSPIAVSPGDWATSQLASEWVGAGATGDRVATISTMRDAAGALVLLVP
jgi:hypothetical protein